MNDNTQEDDRVVYNCKQIVTLEDLTGALI